MQAGVDTEELDLVLHLKEVYLEAKTQEVELMHLWIRPLELERSVDHHASTPVSVHPSTVASFNQSDINRHIALVPIFRDSVVDLYFNVFEHVAAYLK